MLDYVSCSGAKICPVQTNGAIGILLRVRFDLNDLDLRRGVVCLADDDIRDRCDLRRAHAGAGTATVMPSSVI